MIEISNSFQPLDNKTPDIIEINGQRLDHYDPSQQKKRQMFISDISRIVKVGEKEKDSSLNIVIYHKNHEFVIETIPRKKDSLGRIAPIISYGKFPDDELAGTDWIDKVVSEIERFASSIDNNLTFNNNNDILKNIKSTLTVVWNKKKERVQKIVFVCRLVLAVTIPLLLVVILLTIPQTVQQYIPQPILNWLLKIQLLQPVQKQVPPPSIMQVGLFIALNNALMISLSKVKISKLMIKISKLIR
ncbi:MAG: hypothetical protein QNJ55_02060 [Xenococcus sp. MO_188.B8]|nr:hypothetical protein [Xenococcus sp. MO_188.B8]